MSRHCAIWERGTYDRTVITVALFVDADIDNDSVKQLDTDRDSIGRDSERNQTFLTTHSVLFGCDVPFGGRACLLAKKR